MNRERFEQQFVGLVSEAFGRGRLILADAQEVLRRFVSLASLPLEVLAVLGRARAFRAQPIVIGNTAVVPLQGFIGKGPFCADINEFREQLFAARAASCSSIILWINSPGGVVSLIPETADLLYDMQIIGQKPVIAVCDLMCCSAAYWLASQCDRVVVTESSMVGSIGAYVAHEDISGMLEKAGIKITLIGSPASKTDGNPYEPLSKTARASLQAYAKAVSADFQADVARGRGVPKSTVTGWAQNSVVPFRGKDAIRRRLADQTGLFGSVLAEYASKGSIASARAALDRQLIAEVTGRPWPVDMNATWRAERAFAQQLRLLTQEHRDVTRITRTV